MSDWEWLTIAEACRVLKVSRRTLYTYMESGDLPFYQVGGVGHRRIKAEDLEQLMTPSSSFNGRHREGPDQEHTQHPDGEAHTALVKEIESYRREVRDRERELERLRPLEVWAELPCALCKEPLQGVGERKVARALLKKLAHRECIDEKDSGRWFPITFTMLEPDLIPAD